MRLTAPEVALGLGVEPLGRPDYAEAVFEKVSTDTRDALEGALFVALKGMRFDAHDYLGLAVEKGALGVVFQRGESPTGTLAFRVDDTLDALGLLGRTARRKLTCPVAALTGSFGKTTTKEMWARLAQSAGINALVTKANLNNRVGAPMTLLGCRGDERAALIELGISLVGEMEALSACVEPEVALITGVGVAHTEGLGSLAAVAEEKLKIAGSLREGGTLLLPHGEPLLAAPGWLAAKGVRVLTFGWNEGADIRGENYQNLGGAGSRFTVEGRALAVGLPGRHNAQNALAAWALFRTMGFTLPVDAQPLQEMKPPPLRGEIRRTPWGANVLVDCYNANPSAVSAALAALTELAGDARKIAVLGEMRELGSLSESAHRNTGGEVAHLGFDKLYVLGENAAPLALGALEAGMAPEAVRHLGGHAQLAEELAATGAEDDWILIKGSRSMRLDLVADAVAPPQGERE